MCSGWFSSSLKFVSSTLTAIGDSVVWFEGPGLGKLQLLGHKGGKAGEIVAVTGLGVWVLLIFLVVNTGLFLLVFIFFISGVAASLLEPSGVTLLNSETDWWSHKPCTLRDSAERKNDCRRPLSTWTYKESRQKEWSQSRQCAGAIFKLDQKFQSQNWLF